MDKPTLKLIELQAHIDSAAQMFEHIMKATAVEAEDTKSLAAALEEVGDLAFQGAMATSFLAGYVRKAAEEYKNGNLNIE